MTDEERFALDWQTLTDALGVPASNAQAAFADLCRRYAEPTRFYHTLTHVGQMLQTLEGRQHLADSADRNALRFAAWFHDAVYDSRAQNNEARSAALAREVLTSWRLRGDTLTEVERLILATKTHDPGGDEAGVALFLDADLAILGTEPSEYERYSRAIRQEFAWVSEDDYRAGRRRVLTAFLERPQIYRTPPLRDAWEGRARENLRAEIARLSLTL